MGGYIHSKPQYRFNSYNQIDSESMLTEELIKEILNNNVTSIQINGFDKVSTKTFEILNQNIFSVKPVIKLRLYGYPEIIDLKILKNLTNVEHLSLDDLEVKNEQYFSELKKLKSLSLSTKNISNYDFLNLLNPNLEELSILPDEIKLYKSDISSIIRFKKLKSLYILGHYKNIETTVSKLENLEVLVLSKIKTVKNLDFITSLKKLKYLHIKSLPLNNFDALQSLKKIKFIEFYKVENLENLEFINKIESLEHLFLQTVNKITSFPKLQSNCKLRKIELWYMKNIRDFSGLENLKTLKEFSCREMKNNEPIDFLPILKNQSIQKSDIWFLKEGQRQEMEKLYAKYDKKNEDVSFMY